MELTLKRIARRETYTIGHLYIDGVYFCDTIEDTDRGLRQCLPESVNRSKKRFGATAIPTGRYQVTLGVKSPKFSKKKQYGFCVGGVAYINQCLNEGWARKDSIDWTPYEDYFPKNDNNSQE